MHALELKIPPAVVVLVFGALMWLAAQGVPSFGWPATVRIAAAVTLAAVGASFDVMGLVSFRRARTTFNPLRPAAASSLVVTGVYRYTRNPMYVGAAVLLLAWAAFLANGAAFLLVPGFVLYLTRFQIIPEERALTGIFSAEYADYCRRVRRWL